MGLYPIKKLMANQRNASNPLIPVIPQEQQELAGIKAYFHSLGNAIMDASKQLNAKFDFARVWPVT